MRRARTLLSTLLAVTTSLSCAGRVIQGSVAPDTGLSISHGNVSVVATSSRHAAGDSHSLSRMASPEPDTLLVEVRLDGIGHRLTKALRIGAELYVPAQVVFELIGAGARADTAVALVSIHRLRELLGTSVSFDSADLVVTIQPTPEMPAAQRLTRDRLRTGLRFGQQQASSSPSVVAPAGAGVLAVDYDVFGTSSDATRPNYLIRAGVGVFGGELSSTFVSGMANEVAWTLMRPGAPLVSRLQLGSTRTGGLQSRGIQGVSLGNAPPYRPAIIDYRQLGGTLPAGWTVDAFRGGRFFAFDSVGLDGRYSILLPVGYGQNAVDLVAYGPRGERVALQEYLRFSPSMLARGQSEYSMSVGRCVREECQAAGSMEARLGVLSGVTVEGGVLYERLGDGSNRIVPYGSLFALLRNEIGVEVEGFQNAVRRVSARYEPSPLAGVEALWLDTPASTSTSWTEPLAGSRFVRVDAWGSLSPRGAATFRAQLKHYPDPVAPRSEVTLGTSHAFAGAHWRPYTTTQIAGSGSTPSGQSGVELLVPPSQKLPSWLRGTWFRSLVELDHASGRVHRMESTLSRQVTRDLRLETEALWNQPANGLALAVRLVTHTNAFRANARAGRSGSSPHPSTWDFGAGGSLIADPGAGRVVMSSEPSFNRAGLSVLTFLDLNGDGVRQNGEPPVPNAGVIFGNRVLSTNGDGRAYFWGAPALEPIVLSVDSASVPPHWHVPAPIMAVLRGTRSSHFELPLVAGSTLEGRIRSEGVDPAAVSLVLQEENSTRQQSVEIFLDGSFYIMSVRPGSYVLSASIKGEPANLAQRVRVVVPSFTAGALAQTPRRLAEVTIALTASAQQAIPPCTGARCK